jgi:hypothetical protein
VRLLSLRRGSEDWQQMLESQPRVHERRRHDWDGVDHDVPCRKVVLPIYPPMAVSLVNAAHHRDDYRNRRLSSSATALAVVARDS